MRVSTTDCANPGTVSSAPNVAAAAAKAKIVAARAAVQAKAAPAAAPAPEAKAEAKPVPAAAPASDTPTGLMASISVESNVPGADIEIDGAFVGNTPSTVSVAPGSHQIAVKKKGFTDWTRTLKVTSGSVHLNAELEQEPTKQ